jgi:hypothetical protein
MGFWVFLVEDLSLTQHKKTEPELFPRGMRCRFPSRESFVPSVPSW